MNEDKMASSIYRTLQDHVDLNLGFLNGPMFQLAGPDGDYTVTVTRDADRDVRIPRLWELMAPSGRRYIVISTTAARASMLASAREPGIAWSEPQDRGPAVEGTGL